MNKFIATAAGALLAMSTAASAATLSITGGTLLTWGTDNYRSCTSGLASTQCYDPSGIASGLTNDLSIFTFNDKPPGLSLSGGSEIRVTYLGKEAGATNTQSRSFSVGDIILSTATSSIGDSYRFSQAEGPLQFAFRTSLEGGLIASNTGDPFALNMAMGFSVDESGKFAYAYLDDSGAGVDGDFDDMVMKIEVVPLPAGGLLLLTGFGALALRRRKQVAKTA